MKKNSLVTSILIFFALITFGQTNIYPKKNKKKKAKISSVKGIPIHGQWVLETIEKEFNTLTNTTKNSVIQIEPNLLKFNGKGGCNSIGGNLKIEKNNIKFSNIIGTEMFCDNMQQEDLFLGLLEMATQYKIIGGQLMLYKDTNLLMTFGRTQ
jgi:heat shock protein HslJ